jgi:hypothetical protein
MRETPSRRQKISAAGDDALPPGVVAGMLLDYRIAKRYQLCNSAAIYEQFTLRMIEIDG